MTDKIYLIMYPDYGCHIAERYFLTKKEAEDYIKSDMSGKGFIKEVKPGVSIQ